MAQARYPALFQINTRVWLTELSRDLRRPATLEAPMGNEGRLIARERSPCTDLSGGSNAVVDVTGSFNAQG